MLLLLVILCVVIILLVLVIVVVILLLVVDLIVVLSILPSILLFTRQLRWLHVLAYNFILDVLWGFGLFHCLLGLGDTDNSCSRLFVPHLPVCFVDFFIIVACQLLILPEIARIASGAINRVPVRWNTVRLCRLHKFGGIQDSDRHLNEIALTELVPSVSFHVYFHDVVDGKNLSEPRAREFFLRGVAL
jgi:hypothetical protein